MGHVPYDFNRMLQRYPNVLDLLNRIVTGDAYFHLFQSLSDNYSPSLTVSRVQGGLVKELMAAGSGNAARLQIDTNLRRSGSIGVKVGTGRPSVWLTAHADICSYLTEPWDGSGYPLTPFCSHRSSAGRRTAMALAEPRGYGPLERIVEGVRFECDTPNLPRSTRVVHHQAAAWDRKSDVVTGFLDNQAGSAAGLLAAQVLSHLDADVLVVVNDEEEGPVDKGNQGFSRAANRLLHRTPLEELPDYVVVSDGHGQEEAIKNGLPTAFGTGASYAGYSSHTRGAVTPPQLLAFARDLGVWLEPHGILLRENNGYVGRSDDISAMQFTPNVSIIGYPGAYSHFEKPPISHMADLVNLTKTLVIIALMAQDPAWREAYL
ncbi:MAG TPA: hypothetical protein PKA05_07335 [Roseiflexaceae bacterium]|nr:hypothetical protein [Roseiflexaceae bacterium]